ncbi:MAG TPA: NAD(P)-dependent oxidoreductase [Anaerolineae bacterium]|nr:NAD(P)-dependent oxidoreductase [Anaerolineae bacterium]
MMNGYRILLTGGSGDLGAVLTPLCVARGEVPVIFDVRRPQREGGEYVAGSILEWEQLAAGMAGCELVVHIAAWHGIHWVRGEKDVYDFWDLNVTGTFYVMEAAVRAGIKKFIYISSTSVSAWPDVYGSSKVLGEEVVRAYGARHGLEVIVLRPRAFIPHWNRETYEDYVAWARWFWKGAVHIDDVAQAVLLSIDRLRGEGVEEMLTLVVDGAYDFDEETWAHWDKEGKGSSFRRVYPEYVDVAERYGFDIGLKPKRLDMGETWRWLGYEPQYSLGNLLVELAAYGVEGPPRPF